MHLIKYKFSFYVEFSGLCLPVNANFNFFWLSAESCIKKKQLGKIHDLQLFWFDVVKAQSVI